MEPEADAAPKEEIPFLPGQAVEITEGPFSDFNGVVEEVLADKGKVKVSVSLFGRPTTVELDYLQLRGHYAKRRGPRAHSPGLFGPATAPVHWRQE